LKNAARQIEYSMIVFQELLGTVKISFLNLPSKILSRFRFVFTGEKSIEIVIN
jgi:hypothetical protein